MLVSVVAAFGGCFQPRASDERDPIGAPIDLFTIDAPPAPDCPPDPSPLSQLAVSVRTTPYGGNFAPRNVGAIWIERADGTFVKTLERWGQIRAKWLKRFVMSSAGNIVDAVTSATLTSHTTHERVWDLTDLARCEIESGDYQLLFELTDRDGAGEALAIPFTKDQTSVSLSPEDTRVFHDLSIDLN